MSLEVTNPEGFEGFPDHDRSDPAYRVETHGLDPAEFFVHFEAENPLVVEQATGRACHAIIDGKLVPLS
jgi:hypothetical protein